MTMKSALFVAICFFTVFQSTGQTTWAPVGAEWYHRQGAGGGEPIGLGYYYSKVVGDTLVKGQACMKIDRYKKIWTGDIVWLEPLFTYAHNDSVYLYNAGFDRFLLTYDFTAAAGDTLTFPAPEILSWAPNDSTFQVRVDSVVLRQAGATTLRFFYATTLDDSFWGFYGWYAERIGSRMFQGAFPVTTIPEIDGFFRCYSDSSADIRISLEECDYPFTTGVIDAGPILSPLLSPNPAIDMVTITFSNDPGAVLLRLYDVQGRFLKEENVSGAITRLDLRDYTSGIYTLYIWTKGGNIARKISKR